jgi:uncharacterized protein (TIGR01655 family)
MEAGAGFRYDRVKSDKKEGIGLKGKVAAAVVAIMCLVCCVAGGLYYLENYADVYYTQINNTKVRELSTSREMKYEYRLDCYNQSGKKKEITFQTVRVLRDRAYLALDMRAFGLTSWEEVSYDELPEEVQKKL